MTGTGGGDTAAAQALAAWLERLEQLDPARIEPGLDRTVRVLERMGLARPPYRVFSVGGTNGKGSVAAYLTAILGTTDGGAVGTYTSPHLVEYRERIAIDGRLVDAATLVAALDAVETARGDIPLTYFEFGTAAALEVFRRAGVREAVLEVGLGGRLDAVNAVEPAAAAVVSVGLDHQRWLGNDRDSIGREKAGIFRRGRPAIIGDRDPPAGLLEVALETGCDDWRIGRDFDAVPRDAEWTYRGRGLSRGPMTAPGIPGRRQLDNAAVALALLESVAPARVPEADTLGGVLAGVRLGARLERRCGDGVEWVLDVGHNPDAAAALAEWLARAEPRRTHAVFSMLADKDVRAVASAVAGRVDAWYLGGLAGRRGQAAGALAERLGNAISTPVLCENIAEAVEAAVRAARPGDRILVFGSFHTVGEALHTGRVPREGVCASG